MATGVIESRKPIYKKFIAETEETVSDGSNVLQSFTLPKGLWAIYGHSKFSGGGANSRRGFQIDTARLPTSTTPGNTTVYVVGAGNVTANVSIVVNVSADTTYYVSAYNDGHADANVSYFVEGIKLV